MQVARCRWFLITLGASFCLVTPAPADEILLFDDFDGGQLNANTWGLATWNIGDKTQFGNLPTFSSDAETDWITLPLDTFNPDNPGVLVLGCEIYSLQDFEPGSGTEYLARARLTSDTPGLVAAFFTYQQRRKRGRWLSDEIDFEILSKQALDRLLVTSWNDWGEPGSDYDDGVHHLGAFLDVPGYDWREWNTYAMRWFPDRVEWWLNEELIHSQSSPVPDLPQPARASLWAGGTTWPDAHDPALDPASDVSLNVRHEWQVDYIMVTRLGGDGGGNTPAPPADLTAEVSGSTVGLSWLDGSDDENGFNIYRAFKPKGKAQADFDLVGAVGVNAQAYSETLVDSKYLYYITAFNAEGESPASDTVEVVVGEPRGRK